MSNTVKIKKKKKKSELKINYKLWAIVFGVFVAVIVVGAVWASFHWGVGMGTIGEEPMSSEEAAAAATEIAGAAGTDAMVLTEEQLQEMGYSLDDLQNLEDEAALEGEPAEGEGIEGEVVGGEVVGDESAAEDAAAEDAAAEEAGAEGAEAE